MTKDEYDNRRNWKLPRGFPFDKKTMEEKQRFMYGNEGAENGWWYFKDVSQKHIPDAFKKARAEEGGYGSNPFGRRGKSNANKQETTWEHTRRETALL